MRDWFYVNTRCIFEHKTDNIFPVTALLWRPLTHPPLPQCPSQGGGVGSVGEPERKRVSWRVIRGDYCCMAVFVVMLWCNCCWMSINSWLKVGRARRSCWKHWHNSRSNDGGQPYTHTHTQTMRPMYVSAASYSSLVATCRPWHEPSGRLVSSVNTLTLTRSLLIAAYTHSLTL